MSIILCFFLFLLLPALFSLIFVKDIKSSKQNLPPSPPQLPIIGNLHQLRGLFHRCLHHLLKKHGPLILLRLGVLRMVVISSSEAAEEVLKTHDTECCTRPVTMASTVFSRNGNDIGFGEYGEAWRELRKLAVREFFSVTKVRSFRYVREEECDLMVKQLRELALKQSPVDLSKTLFCLTASIVFRSALGQSFLENKHIDKEGIEELMLEAHSNMSFNLTDMFPTAGLGWFMDFVSGQRKRLHDVFTEVDTFLNHIIDDHQSKNFTQDRPDFIDYLLEMIPKQEENESFKLTIDHLKGIIQELAQKKSPVDLSQEIYCVAGSIIFRSAFAQRFYENKHVDKEKIKEFMFELQKLGSISSSDLFPGGLGWFMDFMSGRHRRLHKLFGEVDTFLNHIIDDHLKNPEEKTNQDRPDIVDSLLNTMLKEEQDESFKLTIDHLKGIIQNIYLAGVDTSAITMIWAMAELVRNPRVMKKAQEEIRTCIRVKQNEKIDEEDVDKLQYLKLVIKETLRLHPAAPLLLPRETMSQIKIQGYNIPPKTFLVVNTWSIGRDPKHWEDPEEFIPERFIDSPADYKGQSFEMLPFGSGRRMCPGMASAIATIELGLLNLLYYFDWELPEEGTVVDMEEDGNITVVKKVPLELLPILHH
ncbi:hypothetical protein Bca52824_054793 [Brassica carinata]|uniref:Uncharacterized protein n=1 Tax=Brassica carinata TaxID=52824 RepID=A0A8X7R928_BRACI|nr:hypothetical protein Bca52824_054793 [Brassica carinata]